MPNQRHLKKGEFLFKEGDKASSLYLIQSGGISQCLQRDKKTFDLYQLGATQVLGESCFLAASTHPYSAIATSEVKVLEFTIEEVKGLTEAAGGMNKMLLKSLSERMKSQLSDIKSTRLEKSAGPCPADQAAKIFASIYFTATHKGVKNKSSETEIEWTLFKTFTQRVFGESPNRMEQALQLLVKLKLAKLVMGPSPDDPEKKEVLTDIVFKDLAPIEAFYEIYQYFYFKPGKANILKYEETISRVLHKIVQKADGLALDRFGAVSLDYTQLVDFVKSELQIQLSADLLSRFEQKGLLYKRKTSENQAVHFEFDYREWKNMAFLWQFMREIDRWNELGFVDVDEDLDKPKLTNGPQCTECRAALSAAQKFCSECGAKNSNFKEKVAA